MCYNHPAWQPVSRQALTWSSHEVPAVGRGRVRETACQEGQVTAAGCSASQSEEGCGVISANAAVCSAHPGSGPQHHRGDPQRRTAAQETCRVLAERVVVYCLCFPSDAEVVGLLGRGCCSSAARRFVSFLNSPYSLHVSLVPEPCGLLGWARYE